MRIFALADGLGRKARPCAFVIQETRTGQLQTVICQGVEAGRLPQPLRSYAMRGIYLLEHEQSLEFVQSCADGRMPLQDLATSLPAKEAAALEPPSEPAAGKRPPGQRGFRWIEVPATAQMQDAADARLAAKLLEAYDAAHGADTAAEIGAQLRRERKRQGLTQSQLAARAGVQQAVVSRAEGGRTNPTVGLLEDLARALGMRLEIRLVDMDADAIRAAGEEPWAQ